MDERDEQYLVFLIYIIFITLLFIIENLICCFVIIIALFEKEHMFFLLIFPIKIFSWGFYIWQVKKLRGG